MLKGLTHTDLGANPLRRAQYDIDLLCAATDLSGAMRALVTLGYGPHSGQALSDQHLPPLVKPSHNWKWQGDYYDPDIPIPVEIHTTLWNDERDRYVRIVVVALPFPVVSEKIGYVYLRSPRVRAVRDSNADGLHRRARPRY